MKNLFKHASSSWVRYSQYEWRKDKNGKYYITPAPNATPIIYDPLKEYGIAGAACHRLGFSLAASGDSDDVQLHAGG